MKPSYFLLCLLLYGLNSIAQQCHEIPIDILDGSNGFEISNVDRGDFLGHNVSRAGDINNDGFDDILIGAYGVFDESGSQEHLGEAYIVFGGTGIPDPFDPRTLDGTNGFTIRGTNMFDELGRSVSDVGDFDGDGIEDIVIGIISHDGAVSSGGGAMVLFGSSLPFPSLITPSDLDGSNGYLIEGNEHVSGLGSSVSGLPDINGDGRDEVLVGARFATANSVSDAGKVYLIYGANTLPAIFNVSNVDGSNGIEIQGHVTNERASVVSSIGDVNGDGTADFTVAAPEAYIGVIGDAGKVYVLFGSSSLPHPLSLASLNGTNGFIIAGREDEEQLGVSVDFVGDVNNDGRDDFAIGAPGRTVNDTHNAGTAFILFGHDISDPFDSNFDLSSLDGTNGFSMSGKAGHFAERLGTSISFAGDMNNDGIDDFMIGTGRAGGRMLRGATYIINGHSGTWPAESIADSYVNGVAGFELYNNERFGESFGFSADHLGDVNGDGRDDIVIGEPSTSSFSRSNAALVFYGGSFDIIDNTPPAITSCPGDQITFADAEIRDYTFLIAANDDCNYLDDLIVTQSPAAGSIFSGTTTTVTVTVSDQQGNVSTCEFQLSEGPSLDRDCSTTLQEITNLDGENGFVIEGHELGSNTGEEIDGIGDFNGDGIDDFLITAQGDRHFFQGEIGTWGPNVFGKVYVVFGRNEGDFRAYESLTNFDANKGVVFGDFDNSTSPSEERIRAKGIGDFNGDGLIDIAVNSSTESCDPSFSRCGRTYILYGSNTYGGSFDYHELEVDPTHGFIFTGMHRNDYAGAVLNHANLNNDAYDDIIFGSTEGSERSVYVLFGGATGTHTGVLAASALDGNIGFVMEESGNTNRFGRYISSPGDLNGDGIDDIVLGSDLNDRSYVYYGHTGSYPALFDLTSIDGTNGFVILNTSTSGFWHLSNRIGDINNDSIDDLQLGGSRSVVLFGNSSMPAVFDISTLDGSNGFSISGFSGMHNFDFDGGADFNGDGIDDFLLGPFIIYGKSGGWAANLARADLHPGEYFTLNVDLFGSSDLVVDLSADVNDDGLADAIFSREAPPSFTLNQFASPGIVYVVYGFEEPDITAPSITCPSDQIVSAGSLLLDYTSDAVVSDDCDSSPSVTQLPVPGTTVSARVLVTLTATDRSGNSSQCTFNVNLDSDTVDPEITCPSDPTVNCSSVLVDYTSSASATDDQDTDVEITQDPAPGVDVVDGMIVTLTATDDAGNTDECQITINATDTTDPVIAGLSDQSVDCSVTTLPDYTGLGTVTEDCDVSPTVTQSPAIGSTITDGMTITLTATDASSNDADFTFTLNVTDTTDPVIAGLSNQSVDCSVTALPDYTGLGTVTDNCDANPTVTQSPAIGSTITDGMTITLTATDASGNDADFTFTLNVTDTTDPVIAGLSDQTVDCGVTTLPDYTGLGTASDNCDAIPTVTQSPAIGSTITDGMTITLTATDASGNDADFTFTLNVTDTTDPEIAGLTDQAVDCSVTPLPDYTGLGTVTDNCDINPTVTQSPAIGSTITDGMTITLTATDASGNDADFTFTLNVTDTTDPEIAGLSDQTVDCSVTTLPDYTGQGTVSDNCDINPTVTQSPAIGSAITDGMTITLTATDASGNDADFTFTLNVTDTTDPEIVGLTDQAVDCSVTTLPDYTGLGTVSDNCDANPTVTQSPAIGSTITDGMTITLTATDASGNDVDFTFTLNTIDTVDPVLSAVVNQVQSCGSVLNDYTALTSVTDNCASSVSVVQSPSPGSSISNGMSVSLSATDNHGNTSSISFSVFVEEDNEAPTLECLPDQSVPACTASLPDFASQTTATDQCSDEVLLTQTPSPGTDLVDGMQVSLLATDQNGNTSICQFNVTVEPDNTPPEISCASDLELTCGDELPNLTAEVQASDDCSEISSITQSPEAGLAIAETTEVIVTATDANGNSNTCSVMVRVQDIVIDAGEDIEINSGGQAQLSASAPLEGDFQWSPAQDLDDPTADQSVARPNISTTYNVTFTSDDGCTASDEIRVNVRALASSYGFSPDGDGIGDHWEINGIDSYPENRVQIFNRWGNKVFDIKGYDNAARAFNGTANVMQGMGAGRLPEGTYFFQITGLPSDHIIEKTKGFLVLKR